MKRKSLWTMVISFGLLVLGACSSQSKKTEDTSDTEVDLTMALSKKDTVAVLDLTHQFMTAVKEQRYADAVSMLHELQVDRPYDAPEPLDNEELDATLQAIKAFPVYDYSIADYRFKVAYDNEVRCNVIISPVKEGTSENLISIIWNFKPVRYLGEWKLCFRNTKQGDRVFEP